MQKVMQKVGESGSPLGSLGQIYNQMQAVSQYLQQLEGGLVGMAQDLHALGYGIEMILKILVDKEVLAKEEIEAYHAKCVIEPMQEMAKQMNAKIQEANEMVQKIDEQTVAIQEEEPKPEIESDVILASERGDNVIRFPNGE
jgi:predicted transcriptional regulator